MEKSEQDKQGYSETPYNIYNHNCGVYGVEIRQCLGIVESLEV